MPKTSLSRLDFLKAVGLGTAALALPQQLAFSRTSVNRREALPNILWISAEDISPDLGCYGDPYAVTPNLDRFAAEGTRYNNVYATAGVCAPARSGIITGMYPTTIGTSPMRCSGVPPADVRCFTEYLRAAGYYCANNVKTDYQFATPLTAWDDCSKTAHWRGRGEDQPFFAVFNFTTTHESQIRTEDDERLSQLANLSKAEKHDPEAADLPPYYPDTPIVRNDWARYHDLLTLMDKQVAGILQELEKDGLAENTIVWFWGDHGRGLPRAKRWIYDSGLHVPLIIRVPEQYRDLANPTSPSALAPGSVNNDLVSFIDFAPSMLSLAGIKVPEYMQGQPFLGPQKREPRKYIYAARDRMDEAYDLIRAVRGKRMKYIRNFMPYIGYGQDIDTMNKMPTMQEMRRLHASGKLQDPEKQYFRPSKPVEELYDVSSDPHEIHNLNDDPAYAEDLQRLRGELFRWMRETGDVGLIPEPDFDDMKRPGGEMEISARPGFTPRKNFFIQSMTLTIGSLTPGASIAWREGGDDRAWKLYSAPITIKPDQTVAAKACRPGFSDSEVAEYSYGDPASPAEKSTAGANHWRDHLDRTNLLDRLIAIKEMDGQSAAKSIPVYLESLEDPKGPVRYWAVVGLHNTCDNGESIQLARNSISVMLKKESSPSVQIAAAQALCDWGAEDRGLPILVDGLKHSSDSVRLLAATALGNIGEKALPALPAIRESMEDPYRYVPRVSRYTLERLNHK